MIRATASRVSRAGFATGASAFAAVGIPRFPAGAAEFSYKLGLPIVPTHPQAVRTFQAADRIRKESGGRFEIKVFANSSLGSDTQMLSQLRLGALEIQEIADSILAAVVPAAGLSALDFVFADDAQATAASDGPLGSYIRMQIAKSGLQPLVRSMDDGFKQIIATRPIRTPADMKGLKIRVVSSAVQVAVFKALGASPLPLAFSELYTGLQTHLLDGAELAYSTVEDGKFYEVTKYAAETRHNWIGISLIANANAWARLPANLREMAERILNEAVDRQRADIAQEEASSPVTLQSRHGMTVTKVDFEAFQRAIRKAGLFAQWRDRFGAEGWALLEKSSGRQLA